jgi:toxin ParE1/3/4
VHVRKTELAEKDLNSIYRFGFQHFGSTQADRYANQLFDIFELLAFSPMMERERLEYLQPVRIHPYKANVIVYRIEDDSLVIVRVLSRHQNLKVHL